MKKDDIYRSQFRLPYSLYEKLKESAEANNRSVNAELAYRLEASFVDTQTSPIIRQKNIVSNIKIKPSPLLMKQIIEFTNSPDMKKISEAVRQFQEKIAPIIKMIEDEKNEKP